MKKAMYGLRRAASYMIDVALVGAICGGIFSLGPRMDPAYLLRPSFVMFASYGVILGSIGFVVLPLFWNCLLPSGSLGKVICGLAIYDSTHSPAGFGRRLLRGFTFYLPLVDLCVFLGTRGRTLSDILSRTTVEQRRKTK